MVYKSSNLFHVHDTPLFNTNEQENIVNKVAVNYFYYINFIDIKEKFTYIIKMLLTLEFYKCFILFNM